MAQVTFELTAKQENAVRALLSVEGSMGKVEAAAKKAGQAAGEGPSGLGGTLSALGISGPRDLGNIVTAITGAGGILWAIGQIKASWEEWRAAIKKAGEEMADTARDLAKIVSLSGDSKELQQVQKNINNIARNTGMDDKDVQAMYAAARGSNRAASVGRISEITAVSAGARGAMGGNVEAQKNLAITMAGLSQIYPQASADDLGDMAKQFMNAGGQPGDADFQALNKLVTAGVDPDTAMGLALAASRKQIPVRSLGGLADVLTLPRTAKPGESAFDTQFALERDSNKRLGMLFGGGVGNRASVLGGQANEFETILSAKPMALAASIDVARRENLLRQENLIMLGNKDVRTALQMQSVKTMTGEELETPEAMDRTAREATRHLKWQRLRQASPLFGGLFNWAAEPLGNLLAEDLGPAMGDLMGAGGPPRTYLNAQTGEMETKTEYNRRMSEHTEALKENSRALKTHFSDTERAGNAGLY
jgi:hypothetical protein